MACNLEVIMFDAYATCDWSEPGAVCVLPVDGAGTVEVAKTRLQAIALVTKEVLARVEQGQRVLVGFDFAYGYPRGSAAFLAAAGVPIPADMPPWRGTWQLIETMAAGGGGFKPHDLANAINHAVARAEGGPFWGKYDWTRQREIRDHFRETAHAALWAGKGPGLAKVRREVSRQFAVDHDLLPWPHVPDRSPFPVDGLQTVRFTDQAGGGDCPVDMEAVRQRERRPADPRGNPSFVPSRP